MVVGLYPSRNRFWPVSWRMYGFATQFSEGISREIGWHSHDRIGSANKRVVRTPKPTRGVVRAELGGGNPWWRRFWSAGGRRRWKPTKTGN